MGEPAIGRVTQRAREADVARAGIGCRAGSVDTWLSADGRGTLWARVAHMATANFRGDTGAVRRANGRIGTRCG